MKDLTTIHFEFSWRCWWKNKLKQELFLQLQRRIARRNIGWGWGWCRRCRICIDRVGLAACVCIVFNCRRGCWLVSFDFVSNTIHHCGQNCPTPQTDTKRHDEKKEHHFNHCSIGWMGWWEDHQIGDEYEDNITHRLETIQYRQTKWTRWLMNQERDETDETKAYILRVGVIH